MMLKDIETETLTVVEAARLLGVTPATLRRRIMRGSIPARRDPANRLALRRSDLIAERRRLLTDRPAMKIVDDLSQLPARLTPEEREQGLAALGRIRERQARLLAERGGRPFEPSSLELLDEIREERTRNLLG